MTKRRAKRAPRQRQLGLAVPGWKLYDVDAASGNVTWTRPLFTGAVPVGEAGRGRSRAERHYIRPAIEAIDPYAAWDWISALPAELRREAASNFTFQLRYRDRSGERHSVASPNLYNVEGITRPQLLAQMLADVLILAVHAHGYGGSVTVEAVNLIMAADVRELRPARPKRGRAARRRPSPLLRRKVSANVLTLAPKSLRFGPRVTRRGHYYQPVLDQHGKRRGLVRWYSGVREDVRGLLEVQAETAETAGWEEEGEQ